jgi:hypothetical protein
VFYSQPESLTHSKSRSRIKGPAFKKSAGLIVRRQSLQIRGDVYSRVRETVSFGAEFSSM